MTSVVYFLAGRSGLLKIGTTKRLDQRLQQITSAHGPVELICSFTGGRSVEASLLSELRVFNVEGEWFRDCPEVHEAVARRAASAAPDLDTRWAEQEVAAAEEMRGFLTYLEDLCGRRGMNLGQSHEHLSRTYGIPPWSLWTLRYRTMSVPSAALYVALSRARKAELKAYGLQLVAECSEHPETEALAARLAGQLEQVA